MFLLILSAMFNQEIKRYRFKRLMSIDNFLLLYQNHLCILFMHIFILVNDTLKLFSNFIIIKYISQFYR